MDLSTAGPYISLYVIIKQIPHMGLLYHLKRSEGS